MSTDNFEIQMGLAKNYLLGERAAINHSQAYITHLHMIETMYFNQIHSLIYQLNACRDLINRSEIIVAIKKVDRLFIEAQGFEISAHILFSRHGKSSMWGQKKLGLNANAPLEHSATTCMSITSSLTKDLLVFKTPASIIVSPMTRAIQTAGLIIPENIKYQQISFEPALAENSSTPSGMDIRSEQDMRQLYTQAPKWSLRYWFITLALFFIKSDYAKLGAHRVQALQNLLRNHVANAIDSADLNIEQNLNFNPQAKILKIKSLIEETRQQDLWLIGHGNNFKAFFKQLFGITTRLNYAETRSVYKLDKMAVKTSLFAVPYAFCINQTTGLVEGVILNHKQRRISLLREL